MPSQASGPMTTLIAVTTTLFPTQAVSNSVAGSNASLTSSSRAPTTVTHLVTRTLASDDPTGLPLSTFDSSSKSTAGLTIGLAIGLPVGLFCLGLFVFLFCFYWKDSAIESRGIKLHGDGEHMNEKGWLPNMMYGDKDFDDNSSYLNVKRLPSMSSKIQYKISRPRPQHILTPKAPLCRDSHEDAMVVNDDVDTFLYSRPPNIYHIDSKMPSTNNLVSGSKMSTSHPSSSDSPLRKPSGKWSYQSPLSRWFLRSSTYLQDGLTLPMSIKTPTVQLKQLKILSRFNKEYADSCQFLDDEKSPILDKMDDGSPHYQDSVPSVLGTEEEIGQKSSSVLYGTIDPQTFEVREGVNPHDKSVRLDPVPTNLDKGNRKRKERRQSRLRQHLKQVSEVKPLPVIPKRKSDGRFQLGRVYKVVRQYTARLPDEISIDSGEYVKMLASHTDGWCLVEKCNADGDSNFKGDDKKDINDKSYLNDDRGIIPGDCLQ